MARLARASGGNTLAMLAAFLIPMSALTGSAVDIGRLYLVKVRLQQACDAGALAGRKFMADSNSATLDATATTQARTFFANNFPSGIMGTPAYTAATVPFTPTKTTDKQVAGTATTQVPMTVMKMFGQPTRSITVTCE
ncbi:MAG: pilus assembly protein TadG-related protein, partial [Sphingomonas sp.]